MIQRLIKRLQSLDGHTIEVYKKSGASVIVKVLGLLSGILVSIYLGRTLGADGYGVIALANRIIQFFLIFLLLGVPEFLVKEVSIAFGKKQWKTINKWIKSSLFLNGLVALFVSIILILISPYLAISIFGDKRLTFPLIILFAALTPQIISRILAAGLVGFKKIWQSNLVSETLSSVIVAFILLLFYLLSEEVTINKIAVVYFISRITTTAVISLYWKRVFPYKYKFENFSKTLFIHSSPLLLASSTSIIVSNADSLMLGIFTTTDEVGLYTVAARIAGLTNFFLIISNSVVAPKIASLYSEKKVLEIQIMVHQITKLLLLIGTIPLVLYFFLGENILSIWGNEFANSYWILLILAIGQFFNIGTGASGLLLIMTGFEKIHARIAVIFMLINLVLNLVLIFNLGALGVAIATAITITGENITKMVLAYQKTGILTIPLNFSRNE